MIFQLFVAFLLIAMVGALLFSLSMCLELHSLGRRKPPYSWVERTNTYWLTHPWLMRLSQTPPLA